MPQTFIPKTVDQQSINPTQEIAWSSTPSTNITYLLESTWRTVSDLTHFANPATGDLRSRTQSLVCTNFNMVNLPELITGIQIHLSAQRGGRITDEVIQLTYQGEVIGQNKVNYITDSEGHLPITNDSIYGGATDLWGVEITPAMLLDPTFGVSLKFQSHPYYPHRCSMMLYAVTLTVY